MIRAIVVDDEALARRRIVRLLAERDDVQLVGECSGGEAAVAEIGRLKPDLVFLDVQMPDLDGFQVLQQLDTETLPAVIFVTAYDHYALRAFEACAVDYLLKPYDPDRFTQSLDRAVRWIRTDSGSDQEASVRALLEQVLRGERAATDSQTGGRLDRFMVRRKGRSHFIRSTDVDWIESDGNYIRLHVGPNTHLVRSTLVACAERLDPRQFVRVHRRYIVNIDRVKELQPWFGGDFVILLNDGQKLRLSRHFRWEFQSRMLGE